MELKKLKTDPRLTQELIDEIGKIIVLPTGETPTIATVTDVDKLKITQPFFQNAKNGDKVIVYTKKAILYDPLAKKIIDVTTINPGSPSAQTTAPLRFLLLNGTTKVGLTQKFEVQLKKVFPEAIIVNRDNAKKNTYAKSIIVDINNLNQAKTAELSQSFALTADKLPEGEVRPEDSDFLIILGADKENL